ncbi:MAG: hypothetical protein ACTSP3_02425 [Candidatus Heimdallarchaeaceae archaeon]
MKNYFFDNPIDSLLFWNSKSIEYDVRVDYGGTYLFMLYFYEIFGRIGLKTVINDTRNAVSSLSIYFKQHTTTFNKFYLDWQIALLNGEFNCNSTFNGHLYKSINFSLLPQEIMGELDIDHYFDIPYYGSKNILFNMTKNQFSISIFNPSNRRISITSFIKRANNEVILNQIETTNISINLNNQFFDIESIILIFSFIDNGCPLIEGGVGLGPDVLVKVSIFDPFYLIMKAPSIFENETHILISQLKIYFPNGTEINDSNDVAKVKLVVFERSIKKRNIIIEYDEMEPSGWFATIEKKSFLPSVYSIVLVSSISEFHIEQELYSFTISLDINIGQPQICFLNSTNQVCVSIKIFIFPKQFSSKLFQEFKVTASIFNYTEYELTSFSLFFSNSNKWENIEGCLSFSRGFYYAQVFVRYNNVLLKSFLSHPSFYEKTNKTSYIYHFCLVFINLIILSAFKKYKQKHLWNLGKKIS